MRWDEIGICGMNDFNMIFFIFGDVLKYKLFCNIKFLSFEIKLYNL